MENSIIKNEILEWANRNLNENFKFRKYQLEAIENIINNIVNNPDSNQIIEAPTGSGKSIIIMVSAGVLSDYYNKRSYILCSDLSLWDQYYNFIIENNLEFGYLKGQTGNYTCMKNKNPVRSGECKIAGCKWTEVMKKNSSFSSCAKHCQYIKDRKRACLKRVTLLTYQCFLYTLMHQEAEDIDSKAQLTLTPREIIFCDECHHLPDVVLSQYSPSISATDIEFADKVFTFLEEESKEGLFTTSANFKNSLLNIYHKLLNKDLTDNQNLALLNEFYNLYNLLWFAVKAQEEEYSENYWLLDKNEKLKISKMYKSFESVVLYGDQLRDLLTYLDSSNYLIKEVNNNTVNFYNLKQDFLVYKSLLSKTRHRVMLSATVGNIDDFADNTGIKYLNNQTYTFSRIPSTFNFEKSPIIIYANYKLNWQNKEKLFPKIKEITYNICREFGNEKGIIQTTSYTDALNIYENAPDNIKDRLLVYNNSSEKHEILQEHLDKENSILLGPTLNEGLDLPDDLCRFIIITKIPYPQLNNEFTKRKMEVFKNWYASTTSLKLIQSIGRGVRNEKDYCKTYILDACFFDLFEKTKDQYSDELRNRLIVETN